MTFEKTRRRAVLRCFFFVLRHCKSMVLECASARRRQTLHEDGVNAPKTRVQTSQASRGTRVLLLTYARARRSANSRHGPITTSPNAHRRSSTLPRQRRGAPYVAEVSGAHRAGAARATETEPHPNENRLVAPRVMLGRLSRRRRQVFRAACAMRATLHGFALLQTAN